jgi:hypothetical protein
MSFPGDEPGKLMENEILFSAIAKLAANVTHQYDKHNNRRL